MYQVKLEKFEGPLDLLYQLIESKKLEITEISLAQVADQFLSYFKSIGQNTTENLANFIAIAGRLALIKSRALLPFLEFSKEEENDISSLQEQLAEYKKYKNLAYEIAQLDKSPKTIYSRNYFQNLQPVFYFPKNLDSSRLAWALHNLLAGITLPQRIPQAQAVDAVPLEKIIEALEKNIKSRNEFKFSEVLKSDRAEEKVITFLGVLELLKRARIETSQASNFSEIIIKRTLA